MTDQDIAQRILKYQSQALEYRNDKVLERAVNRILNDD